MGSGLAGSGVCTLERAAFRCQVHGIMVRSRHHPGAGPMVSDRIAIRAERLGRIVAALVDRHLLFCFEPRPLVLDSSRRSRCRARGFAAVRTIRSRVRDLFREYLVAVDRNDRDHRSFGSVACRGNAMDVLDLGHHGDDGGIFIRAAYPSIQSSFKRFEASGPFRSSNHGRNSNGSTPGDLGDFFDFGNCDRSSSHRSQSRFLLRPNRSGRIVCDSDSADFRCVGFGIGSETQPSSRICIRDLLNGHGCSRLHAGPQIQRCSRRGMGWIGRGPRSDLLDLQYCLASLYGSRHAERCSLALVRSPRTSGTPGVAN
jgi:hypothetical protein